ncbi:hypothetical protein FF38_01097 [Lucilia cuprina]|uniref:Uncharacterized protein n=1 Tax=Lucilia cuprina TaxID=7375 RepID=A0A0L0C519_LUCCU|nr:hypothetical protein FF38_01097 [Lucilia cuprina]
MREMCSSKRSGVGVEDLYEPKLWCFNQLEFLRSHCNIRKLQSNITQTIVIEDDATRSQESEPESQPQSTSYKRVRTGKRDLIVEIVEPRNMKLSMFSPNSHIRPTSLINKAIGIKFDLSMHRPGLLLVSPQLVIATI